MSAVRRNMISLFFNQIATWLITFALLLFAPDRLGATDFGKIQFVIAYIGFFTLIGSFGSSQLIVKQVARDPSSLTELVVNGLGFKLVLGVGLAGLAQVVALLLGYRSDVQLLILIGSATMVFGLLNEVLASAFSGLERMARPAFWMTMQVYAGNIAALVIVFTTKSIVAMAAGFAVASAIPVIANYRSIRPLLARPHRQSLGAWKAIIWGGATFVAIASLGLVYGTIDIPILEKIAGADEVGRYTVAYRWISVPIFTTTIVVSALLPRLSAVAHTAGGEFEDVSNKAIRLVSLITVPASVGIAVVSRPLFDLLYGDEFSGSVLLARILSIHIPFAAVDSVLVTCMMARDRQRRFLVVALVAAILNPIFDVLAIHWTSRTESGGALGASIVTVATELFISVCVVAMRERGVLDRSTLGFLGRCILAAGAMAGVMLVLMDLPLPALIIVGCVVYAIASVVLRTAPMDLIRSTLGRLGGRSASIDEAPRPDHELVD